MPLWLPKRVPFLQERCQVPVAVYLQLAAFYKQAGFTPVSLKPFKPNLNVKIQENTDVHRYGKSTKLCM